MLNYLFIGGGPSSIYCAKQLELANKTDILIIEKSNYLGGRTRMIEWHDQLIVTGAGIGRWTQDKLLKKEINPTNFIKTSICYTDFPSINILCIIKYLKTKYNDSLHSKLSFQNFFLQFYSKNDYDLFCYNVGYTDYINENCYMVLYHYNFKESMNNFKIFKIKWNDFILNMIQQLKNTNIKINCKFLNYFKKDDYFIVNCLFNNQIVQYNSKKLIWAGHLYKYPHKNTIKHIGYNCFLRYYILLNEPSKKLSINCTEYRNDYLQKIIKITDLIYMISYSDNENAKLCNKKSIKQIEKHLKLDVKIIDSIKFFWKKGTHYYKPSISNINDFIKTAQNPLPNIYLIGEIISKNQGWTEGALESVHTILGNLI
jgi:hypothetical protein